MVSYPPPLPASMVVQIEFELCELDDDTTHCTPPPLSTNKYATLIKSKSNIVYHNDIRLFLFPFFEYIRAEYRK